MTTDRSTRRQPAPRWLQWAVLLGGACATTLLYLASVVSLEDGALAQNAMSAHWIVSALQLDALPSVLAACGLVGTLVLFMVVRKGDRQTEYYATREEAAMLTLHLREQAMESSATAFVICSATVPGYPVEYINPAFERMTGYSAADMLGKSLRLLHRDDRDQPGLQHIRAITTEKREGHAVLRNYRKDGSMFWTDVRIAPVRNARGEVTHFVASKYDITEAKLHEQKLEYQASHDPLTGLANRKVLDAELARRIASPDAGRQAFWVMFVDLDRFKVVNSTLGHPGGDLLLKETGARISVVLRPGDLVARYGGDEFALLIDARNDAGASEILVQRIMAAISQPINIFGHEFIVTMSAGVARYPDHGSDPGILVRNADSAMSQAKQAGRNTYYFYQPEMSARALERAALERGLRLAIERKEFELHYQPQADLATGALSGAEALIRWRHPERGFVSPADFIGIAEETGLIVPLGYWILREACRQNMAWQHTGLAPLRVAVNVSPRQFKDPGFVLAIIDILADTGLQAQHLELEVTESSLMDDVAYTVTTLTTLKELGVHIAIDDFGTGYSSLGYLKRLPIDLLKIDRSFVQDIVHDPDDAIIVKAVISLAHNLNIAVIAEGVEDEEQLAYLRENHCDQMQGYYFSKPLPASEFLNFVRAREPALQA